MRRRRFLKLSLFSAFALGGVATLGSWVRVGEDKHSRAAPVFAGSKMRHVLSAALLRILHGAEPPPELDGGATQLAFIEKYLLGLDEKIRDDVGALLFLLEYFPLTNGYASRFSRLLPAAQDAVLSSWQRSRFHLLRQGFAGLKALCFFAHYQDERSFSAIGYAGPTLGT